MYKYVAIDIDNVLADTHNFLRESVLKKFDWDMGDGPRFWG